MSKLRTHTPRCLLEHNRYQGFIESESNNRSVRRAAAAAKRKVNKHFLPDNLACFLTSKKTERSE